MKYYLVTFHETDGNDATVFDAIVGAESEKAAVSKVADSIETDLTAKGTLFSEDGNELGYYFDCNEDCPEDCDGHGGIVLRSVTEYQTETGARLDRSRYHSEWTVDNGE